MSRFQDAFIAARPLLCAWCTIPSAFSTEIVARSNVDLLFVDGQHGMMGWDTVLEIVRAITPAEKPILVRVPGHEPEWIMQALDAGADGVIVPLVRNAAEAWAAVAACRFPPHGERSWGPVRASLFGPVDTTAMNERVACIVMIESYESAQNAAEIIRVPGVDGVLVGAYDLALSMTASDRDMQQVRSSDEYQSIQRNVATFCTQTGIPAGIPCFSPHEAAHLTNLGYTFFILPSDAATLHAALNDLSAGLAGAAHVSQPAPNRPNA